MNCCSGHSSGQNKKSQHHTHNATIVIMAIAGLAIMVGIFYLTGHTLSILSYWPYLFLLLCPAMHLFHGHGNHTTPEKHEGNDKS